MGIPLGMGVGSWGLQNLIFLLYHSSVFQYFLKQELNHIWVRFSYIITEKKKKRRRSISWALHHRFEVQGFTQALGQVCETNSYDGNTPHLKNLLCSFLHPGPDLVAKPPECVELENGVQPLHGLWVVELRHQHVRHSLRDFHRTQQEHGS